VKASERIVTPTGALRVGPSLLLSLLGVALALGFTIAYVHQVDQRRARSAQQALEADRRAAEQNRAVACALINAQVAAYEETPPATMAGQNIADSWRTLKVTYGC
jgi:uncharacterized protein HemX